PRAIHTRWSTLRLPMSLTAKASCAWRCVMSRRRSRPRKTSARSWRSTEALQGALIEGAFFHSTLPQQPVETLHGYRLRIEKPLRVVAARLQQQLVLGLRGHAFGHDLQAKAVGHHDNGLAQRQIVGVVSDVAYKELVDLDEVDVEPL